MRGPGYAPHSALEKLSQQLPHVFARSSALLVGSFGHVCLCAPSLLRSHRPFKACWLYAPAFLRVRVIHRHVAAVCSSGPLCALRADVPSVVICCAGLLFR